MSLVAANFWPWFWTLASLGAVATVALSLLVAVIARPRGQRRQSATPQAPSAPAVEPASELATSDNQLAERPSALV